MASQHFTNFNPNNDPQQLFDALLDPNANLTANNVSFTGHTFQEIDGSTGSSASFYDGGIEGLGIDQGILLTSGDATPPLENTSSSYGISLGQPGDPDLDIVAQNAFSESGETYDATILELSFTAPEDAQSVNFNLLFGSDEYPEFSDSLFVDVAGVFINGKNYAFFNNQQDQPLSVIDKNIELGNFRNNTNESINDATENADLGLEYDGISSGETIQAPIEPGAENTIKIAVADTGDHIYDSGIFLANLSTDTTSGGNGGLFIDLTGTDGPDELIGNENDQFITGKGGDDTIDPKGGNDVVLAGEGDDIIFGGQGNNDMDGGPGNDTIKYNAPSSEYEIKNIGGQIQVVDKDADNSDILNSIETVSFSDKDVEPEQTSALFGTQNGFLQEGATFADVISPDVTDVKYYKLWDQKTGEYYMQDAITTNGDWVSADSLSQMPLPYETNKFYVSYYSKDKGQSDWNDFTVSKGSKDATVGLANQEFGPNTSVSYDQVIDTSNFESGWIKIYSPGGEGYLTTENGGWIKPADLSDYSLTTGETGQESNIWVKTYLEGDTAGWENFKVSVAESDETQSLAAGAELENADQVNLSGVSSETVDPALYFA